MPNQPKLTPSRTLTQQTALVLGSQFTPKFVFDLIISEYRYGGNIAYVLRFSPYCRRHFKRVLNLEAMKRRAEASRLNLMARLALAHA